MSETTKKENSAFSHIDRNEMRLWITFGCLVVLLIWSYWNTLARVARTWGRDDLYSHGYIIPLFAAVLMFMRYRPIEKVEPSARWAGVGVIVFGTVMRLVSSYLSINTFDNISFVPCLLGIVLIVGGWSMFKWAGPAVGFLLFMFPLPGPLEQGILMPMQQWATRASTYTLQTVGVEVFRRGNTIILENRMLNVVDACSGLRMSTILFALTVAVALVIPRPWWERLIIVCTAVPVALAVNVIRICSTALILMALPELSPEASNQIHDWAGLAMMPVALGLVYLEYKFLANLFIEEEVAGPSAPSVRPSLGGGRPI